MTHKIDHIFDHKITPQSLRRAGACWTDEDILKWFNGRTEIRMSDALRSRKVDRYDKDWILMTYAYMLTAYPYDWIYKGDHPKWLRAWRKKNKQNGI